MAQKNSESRGLKDEAFDPSGIPHEFPHETGSESALLKRRSLEDESTSLETHTCKCGDKVSNPRAEMEPYANLLMDMVNHLMNENRQMKQEFIQMRQSLQQYEVYAQSHRTSMEEAHEKLDRVNLWIDSQTIGEQQLAHETSQKESKALPEVIVSSELTTCPKKPGELTWTIDDYQERKRQLTSNIIRCLDSPEFETVPTGYRMRLRLWMSKTGVEIGVRMLESHPNSNSGLSWPVCCQVTAGLVENVDAQQFLFQESLEIEYKSVAFCSQSVMRFPIALVNRAATKHDLVVIKCLATDTH